MNAFFPKMAYAPDLPVNQTHLQQRERLMQIYDKIVARSNNDAFNQVPAPPYQHANDTGHKIIA